MKNTYFIKHVHLGGYKSIQDTKVDFLLGLNIVIGKNGTGKSNFFEFLNKSMNLKFAPSTKIHFEAVLQYEDKPLTYKYSAEEVKKTGKPLQEKILNVKGEINYETENYFVNKNIIQKEKEDIDISELEGNIYTEKRFKISDVKYIKYGHPSEIKEDLLLVRREIIIDFPNIIEWGHNIFEPFVTKYKNNLEKMREYMPELAEILEGNSDFTLFLKYSPIQKIRYNRGITVKQVGNDSFEFGNIFWEYQYNNQWFSFDELSDGTQRVLHIIYEITFNSNKNPIILLEEPELGIHPHQFHLLMNFLKEASESKQIIISTHSPQALNVLNVNELDRIIVADMTEGGTQFRHLSEKTKAKARKYMENEDSLGAFWLHSDLENA